MSVYVSKQLEQIVSHCRIANTVKQSLNLNSAWIQENTLLERELDSSMQRLLVVLEIHIRLSYIQTHSDGICF